MRRACAWEDACRAPSRRQQPTKPARKPASSQARKPVRAIWPYLTPLAHVLPSPSPPPSSEPSSLWAAWRSCGPSRRAAPPGCWACATFPTRVRRRCLVAWAAAAAAPVAAAALAAPASCRQPSPLPAPAAAPLLRGGRGAVRAAGHRPQGRRLRRALLAGQAGGDPGWGTGRAGGLLLRLRGQRRLGQDLGPDGARAPTWETLVGCRRVRRHEPQHAGCDTAARLCSRRLPQWTRTCGPSRAATTRRTCAAGA